MLIAVFLLLLFSPGFTVQCAFGAIIYIKRRDTNLGKFKMVGTIITSCPRVFITRNRLAVLFCKFFNIAFQFVLPFAGYRKIVSFTVIAQSIHIKIGNSFVERVYGVGGIIF